MRWRCPIRLPRRPRRGRGGRGCRAPGCCAGLLIGVVTTDPAGFDSRRLVTTPLAAILGDPSFSELAAACRGRVAVPTFLAVLRILAEYADIETGRDRSGPSGAVDVSKLNVALPSPSIAIVTFRALPLRTVSRGQ